MPDIEIIDKVDVPAGYIRWRRLLSNLAYNKAIKVICSSEDEAKRQRNNLATSFKKTKKDFYIETQITHLGTNLYVLFIWKEIKTE